MEDKRHLSHQEEINAILEQVAKTYQQLSLEEPILDAVYKEFRMQEISALILFSKIYHSA